MVRNAIEPLNRFLEAQCQSYEDALKEIKAGRKLTHWMWWIFPQYRGLGYSEISQYYAIQSKDEALAYWKHPVLGGRLRACIEALLALDTNDAVAIFGPVDAQKLKSSMTLFLLIGEIDAYVCGKVLDKFFGKEYDLATLTLWSNEGDL